jgi:hypothetical protein
MHTMHTHTQGCGVLSGDTVIRELARDIPSVSRVCVCVCVYVWIECRRPCPRLCCVCLNVCMYVCVYVYVCVCNVSVCVCVSSPQVVFLTDVAGVFDKSPELPGAQLISRVGVRHLCLPVCGPGCVQT